MPNFETNIYMALFGALTAELEHEGANTRKILERIPADKLTWKPHHKSSSLGALATHLASLPSWVGGIMNKDQLDLVTVLNTKFPEFDSPTTIMTFFEEQLLEAKNALKEQPDASFMKEWTLQNNGQTVFKMPKIAVLRAMVLSHIIHHRAQLGVYLRLLDIPLPGIYGPSADEK